MAKKFGSERMNSRKFNQIYGSKKHRSRISRLKKKKKSNKKKTQVKAENQDKMQLWQDVGMLRKNDD